MTLPDARWQAPFVLDAQVLPHRAVRVLFGLGFLRRVGNEASRLGPRALLIAGPHEDPAVATIEHDLGPAAVGRLRDITQHVPTDLAATATRHALRTAADVLVAVGGGSATGLAKAIARETGLPILAVPTTYAGSEMTPIWGLTDGEGKTTGRDPGVLPLTVVYDPALTVSLPAQVTGPSGMNALAHALEALYAADATAEITIVAVEAMAHLAAALPRAVHAPDDLEARSAALYGAWLAGWALGATTMGLHHKLAHVLGGGYRLPHAGTHSALLPQVAAFNAPAAPDAFARAAGALGAEDGDRVAAALFDLARTVDAPTSLASLGLPQAAVPDVAASVASSAEAGRIVNPRPVTEPALRDLLAAAFVGTRPGQLTDRAAQGKGPR